MATRIIAAWYQMGQDASDLPVPGSGIPEDLSQPHTRVIGWNASFKDTLYRGALEGHVLLKNEGSLPLKSPELISVFGYSAKTPDQYNVGSFGFNGGSYPLAYGADYNGTGSFVSGVTSGIARNGTIISGGGSGASQPPWISSPFQALTERAQEDLTSLYWDFHSTNPYVDATSDACIVDVNVFATGKQLLDTISTPPRRNTYPLRPFIPICTKPLPLVL
jgi:beta-glucosidase